MSLSFVRTRSVVPVLLILSVAQSWAQGDRDSFRWEGALAAGKTLEIVGVNGGITAEGTSGRQAEVTAHKKGNRSDPETVTFDVVEHPGGVTICAVYPSVRREPNECLPGGKGRMNTRNNDVEVEWIVRVPAGVEFAGRTVNGKVAARALTAPATARTVNGSISLETSSWAEASTVNGSISARMGRADWEGEAEFSTVNGGIVVYLPSSASFQVNASNVNGGLDTDFPLTVQGRWGPRRMSGTIGQGGRSLNIKTVNGSLELRKQ